VKKQPSSESSGAGTLYLVHALTHASRARLDDALRHLELSSLQYTILSVLAHNENLSSSRLSRRFYVTPQTMGEIILLLERKGLIDRREDPANRKALLLSLTRLGKAVCAEGDVHVRELERSVFGNLSGAEHATLRSVLSRTIASLRADDDRRRDDVAESLTRIDARPTPRAPRVTSRRFAPRRVAGGD
jgi:DNA-binding MarR family transcriptional regulator